MENIISKTADANPIGLAIKTALAIRQQRAIQALQQAQQQSLQTQTQLAPGKAQALEGLQQAQTLAAPKQLGINQEVADARKLQAETAAKTTPLIRALQLELLEHKVKTATADPSVISEKKESGKKWADRLDAYSTAADVADTLDKALDKASASYDALPDSAKGPVYGHRGITPFLSSMPILGVDASTRSNAQMVQAYGNEVVQSGLQKLKGISARINIPLIQMMKGQKPNIFNDPEAFHGIANHWKSGTRLTRAQSDFYHTLTAQGVPHNIIDRMWANYLKQPNEDWRKSMTPQAIADAESGKDIPTPPHLDISPHYSGTLSQTGAPQTGQIEQRIEPTSDLDARIEQVSKKTGKSVEVIKRELRKQGLLK